MADEKKQRPDADDFTNCVIDISHHQADVDFVKLAASGVKAIIHKASEGESHQDSLYMEHRAAAKAAGLLWGAYHLGDNSDAGEQVKNFLAAALPEGDTLLALQWLDMGGGGSSSSSGGDGELVHGDEDDLHGETGELDEGKQEEGGGESTGGGSTMTTEQVRKFVTLIAEQQGKDVVLCSGSVVKAELGGKPPDPVLGNCPLWIVQYADKPKNIPATWANERWTLWQYTDGSAGPEPHEAPGVGPCYRDRFNGSEAEFKAFWGGSAPEHGREKVEDPTKPDRDKGRR